MYKCVYTRIFIYSNKQLYQTSNKTGTCIHLRICTNSTGSKALGRFDRATAIGVNHLEKLLQIIPGVFWGKMTQNHFKHMYICKKYLHPDLYEHVAHVCAILEHVLQGVGSKITRMLKHQNLDVLCQNIGLWGVIGFIHGSLEFCTWKNVV